jgi:hypothetical protein
MFRWDEKIERLDVSAAKIRKLFRSMRDVQLALPGLPSQEASAYLCQYQEEKLFAAVAVFHLHRSSQLAFYFSEPRGVTPQKADSQLDQGLNFVESMGFLLSDMDLELMGASDREMLWESLPFRQGITPAAKEPAKGLETVAPSVSGPAEKKATIAKSVDAKPAAQAVEPQEKAKAPAREARPDEGASKEVEKGGPAAEHPSGKPEDVDDLLAAVEGLRTRRSGLVPRKKQPTPEETRTRCQQLVENLGRILASL